MNMTDQSIKLENYKENPELEYSNCEQYRRNLDMFIKTKRAVLQPSTRNIYEYVKNSCIDKIRSHPQFMQGKFVWRPKIVDVGCGGGFGSNIMSQEADFVWGIDVDEPSIKWAKLVFEKHKNGIYYTPQITFDVVNFMDESRELMSFDIVVCVEVIEHVNEYEKLLAFLKKLCKKNKAGHYIEPESDGTVLYISTPNRNSSKIGQEHPHSNRHVREWAPAELYEVLTKHFKFVTLMNSQGELRDLDMAEADMLFKCELPL